MPVYVGQNGLSGTPAYVRLRQFTSVGMDVELDNIKLMIIKVYLEHAKK